MSTPAGESPTTQTRAAPAITVRYWASARAAAGCDREQVAVDGPVSLAELTTRLADAHPGSRLREVLEVCSVLVGDRPARSSDPGDVIVRPGDSVEFLPPFAGG